MIQQQYIPWTPTWLQVAAQDLDIHVAFGDNMGHVHQHRSHLQWDHEPRHGPWQQP